MLCGRLQRSMFGFPNPDLETITWNVEQARGHRLNIKPMNLWSFGRGVALSQIQIALMRCAALWLAGLTGLAANGESFDWRPKVSESNWSFIVLHHSATESGSVESIDADHRSRKDADGKNWLGIGYHFVIGNGNGMPDGYVQPTFRWTNQLHGAHSGNALFNSKGIGICLIGHFEQRKPTAKQLTALKQLVIQLSDRYRVQSSQVVGHSAVRATTCPGRYFPMSEIRKVIESSVQG